MEKRAKIITITSWKGGAGKTAIASLLARYFTEVEGKKVLVIDLDARGGITSLLCRDRLANGHASITELLLFAEQGDSVQDAYDQVVVNTGLEKSKNWNDNGGNLYIIPAKPALDTILPKMDPSLLRTTLLDLGLSNDYIVLIDTGPDGHCVVMGTGAADVLFLPLLLSKQDVHPTVETLKSIYDAQKEHGNAVLGGMIVNQSGGTIWEKNYIERYAVLVDRFQKDSRMQGATDSVFIELNQSRIIKKGAFLDWSFREDFLNMAQAVASAVNAVKVIEHGVRI